MVIYMNILLFRYEKVINESPIGILFDCNIMGGFLFENIWSYIYYPQLIGLIEEGLFEYVLSS